MKLYICWGPFRTPGAGHPCRNALDALRAAGHEPELVRCYGWGALPSWLNRTRGRSEVRSLTGSNWVPVLVTDDQVVQGTPAIRDWAANAATAHERRATPRSSGPLGTTRDRRTI